MNNPLLKLKKHSFLGILLSLLTGDALFDIEHLKKGTKTLIGDLTFKEIHDLNKWNLNITVTDSNKTDEARLLNYLTAPNVLVYTAAAASGALPMFFDPVELLIKTETGEIQPYHPNITLTRYVDGTLGGDLPMQRMSELFNVNTFIVSQVNPHVVPLVSVDGGGILESKLKFKLVNTLKSFVGNEFKHAINQLDTLGILPLQVKRLSYLLTQ